MNSMNTNKTFTPRAALPAVAACAAVLMAACADMSDTQRRTATGAGVGAVAGAVVGEAAGHNAGAGALIGGALGAIAGNVWSHRMEEKQRALQQATQGTGVEVTRTADNQLKLNVPADLSFDTGRADIKPAVRDVLDRFAQGLQNEPTAHVRIVGHTDATGTDDINASLSARRAQSVRDYLIDRGVQASRVEAVGRGSTEPVASNDTAEGRARNRRVEIFLGDSASS
jgi:outer membrane protein OmpA-like peptidoglycan-associated protein